MSELMVDHLEVAERTPNLVRHLIKNFAPHGPRPLGRNARYSIPRTLLENKDRAKSLRLPTEPARTPEPYPDVFPVRVLLPKRGDYSQPHDHPGEEILLILRGKIRLRFDRLNIFTELGPKDYAHFYADQPHTAINVGDGPAEMLVLRAYLLATGPRKNLYWTAKEFEKELLEPDKLDDVDVETLRGIYRSGIGAWLGHALLSNRKDDGQKIADAIGLARQLRAMGYTADILVTARDAALKAGKKLGMRLGKRKYWELLWGFLERDADIKVLEHLAVICDLPPALLYCYLFNRVPGVSVIRYRKDLKTAPGRPPSPAGEIEYKYPRHNLADSGMTITYLEMPPGSSSLWNRHNGSEYVVPVRAENVRVELKSDGKFLCGANVSSSPRGYLHYASHLEHRLYNDGHAPASVFVVRLFDTLLPAVPSRRQKGSRMQKPR
jgi:hypothetical protein